MFAPPAAAHPSVPGGDTHVPAAPRASAEAAPPDPYGHSSFFGGPRYRSPGLAVALSLTPLPVDFGNLYAENIGWGIAYSAAELSLMVPAMWLVGGHMGGRDGTRDWSGGDRATMIGLATGYVAVKLVAGLHAGHAARQHNAEQRIVPHAAVVPTRGGALASIGFGF